MREDSADSAAKAGSLRAKVSRSRSGTSASRRRANAKCPRLIQHGDASLTRSQSGASQARHRPGFARRLGSRVLPSSDSSNEDNSAGSGKAKGISNIHAGAPAIEAGPPAFELLEVDKLDRKSQLLDAAKLVGVDDKDEDRTVTEKDSDEESKEEEKLSVIGAE